MRAKSILLLMIALGCGLVASVSVSQFLEKSGKGNGLPIEMVQIYVAATEISSGEKLEAHNVKLVEWPKDRVPEGAIRNMDEFAEKFSRTRMYVDEPILQTKIADRNVLKAASPTIPEGFRVVAVKVDVDSVVAGLVQPGDRVDLILVIKKSNESPETIAKTILKEVSVFAVDAETERSVDKDGRALIAKTVSLLVKPPQMETVVLASEMGRLTLALRRPNDSVEDDTKGATMSELLGNKAERPGEPTSRPADGDAFVRWLNGSLTSRSTTPSPREETAVAEPPAPLEETSQPVWTIDIFSGAGQRRYEWLDMKQPPREVITNPVTVSGPSASGTTTLPRSATTSGDGSGRRASPRRDERPDRGADDTSREEPRPAVAGRRD